MKTSEKKLLILEIFALVIFLLNIFIKNVFIEYSMALFISVLFGITFFMVGFEKKRLVDKKKVIILTSFYTVSFLVMLYGIGLLTGYVYNAYSLRILSIIRNILPVILLIISTEVLRYNICQKGQYSRIVVNLTIVLFTLVDILMMLHLYDLNDLSQVLRLITIVILPSLSKNFMLTRFTKRYGFYPCLIYRLIIELYVYVIPILPDFGVYLESVIMFLLPILMYLIISYSFREKSEQKKKVVGKLNNALYDFAIGFTAVIIIIIVSLCSNLFPYWIAAIGSGSMTPTIEVGDAVIVDKHVQKDLDKLKVGDVLVFKIQDTIYTHRIVEINKENELYKIATKGDRKENSVDNWIVTNDDVVGIVRFKIPYIGLPTIWLNSKLKES